jgi:hypothetical protein
MKNLNGPLSVVALLAEPFAANATLVGPIPYRCFADNPSVRAAFSAFPLEDFDSDDPGGAAAIAMPFNVHPGASRSDPFDPAAHIDGEMEDTYAGGGHTWFASSEASLTFTFSTALLGSLPTDAGLLWTDIGLANVRTGTDSVLFEAFDAEHNLLGVIGPSSLGDGLFAGQTAEDRFFGVTSAGGIASIRITSLSSTERDMDQLPHDPAEVMRAMGLGGDSDSPTFLALLIVGSAGIQFRRRRLQS